MNREEMLTVSCVKMEQIVQFVVECLHKALYIIVILQCRSGIWSTEDQFQVSSFLHLIQDTLY